MGREETTVCVVGDSIYVVCGQVFGSLFEPERATNTIERMKIEGLEDSEIGWELIRPRLDDLSGR